MASHPTKKVDETTRNKIRACIHDWIQIDNKVSPEIDRIDTIIKQIAKQRKQLMAQKKQLNEQKKEKTDEILEIIKKQEVDSINIQGGKLIYKRRVTKQTITKNS